MRAACLLLFLVFLFHCRPAAAQLASTPDGPRQPRILLLLDGSSSMLNPWGKDLKRFTAAAKIISSLMDSIYAVNNGVEFGLRVYGHQTPAQNNDCYDTRREVMFSKNNATQMALRLASIQPLGVSPIAYALKEAADNDLEDEVRNAYSIILITDGGESCGGDICNVVATLIQRKIYFKPYILSLVDYAPLRTQYACLGKYLQVANDGDILPAIDTIVADYRPLLTMPAMRATATMASATPKPDFHTVDIPAWIPQPSGISYVPVSVAGESKLSENPHYVPLLHTISVSRPTVPRLPPEPVVAIVPVHTEPPVVKTTPPVTKPVTPVATPTPPVIKATPVAKTTPPVIKTPAVKPTPPHGDTVGASVSIMQLPPVKTTPLPVKPAAPKKEAEIVVSTEDAKETSVDIYFTDGHGKFFKSTPELEFADDATGKTVKKFYRTVNELGNPDAQILPGGVYTMYLSGRARKLKSHVTILANKKNKILITVGNGSIKFVYEDAPDRPVTEFAAQVSMILQAGPKVTQHCDVELEYPPADYRAAINTLPVLHKDVPVDFDLTYTVSIPQPGFLQVTNGNPLGKVTLYYQLGDRFAPFYSINVTGNVDAQKVRLQPGAYEVHWFKNPNMPYASETVLRFYIKSNSLTQIRLQ